MPKKPLILIAILFIAQILSAQKLTILHTNDLHSKLTGFGPESEYSPMTSGNDNTLGGFARIAQLIKQNEKGKENQTLVLDAGDFLMGTIFHAAENKTGFQISLMSNMGYDALVIGNHEFDFGPQFLADAINKAKEKKALPTLLASQFQFSDESNKDDGLEILVKNETIKPYQVFERNGIKIGVFGIIGEDAVSVAPAAAPLTFADRFETAEKTVKQLKENENAELIICLSHSGIYPDENGNMTGEDIELAEKVSGIDLIISGHTHITTKQAIKAGNSLIVQTGAYGKNMGKIELNCENGTIESYSYELIPVNDEIPGEPYIHKQIESYKKKIDKMYFAPVDLSYGKAFGECNFEMQRGSYKSQNAGTIGTLVADAVNYYTDTYSQKTDLVLIAAGTIRENIKKGKITPADVFRVVPLGYGKSDLPGSSLSKIYITGREIKKLMEVIILNNKPGADSYLYFSGAEVYYNPDKMFLRKVQKINIDGKTIDISRKAEDLYSITANTYLLSFIGRIKKMSKGLVKIVPKNKQGIPVDNIEKTTLSFRSEKFGIYEGKEWIGVIKYIKQFKDTDDDNLPEIPDKYRSQIKRLIEVQ